MEDLGVGWLAAYIYKSMVKPVVVCGSETWTVTELDMKRLGTGKRNILRRIHGTVGEKGLWRIRTNREYCNVFHLPCINQNHNTQITNKRHFNVYDEFCSLNSHQHVSASIAIILRVKLHKYKNTNVYLCSCNKHITLSIKR